MNSFGQIFRLSIFGESHGPAIGVVIDGTPPGIPFGKEDMAPFLARRKAGAAGTTPRQEADEGEIASGVFQGKTTGSPICILFRNSDTRSADYDLFTDWPRPGHADMSARAKFGPFYDKRGSGHFSGRITLGLVASAALGRKIIVPTTVSSRILEAGGRTDIDAAIQSAMDAGDSIGAIVELKAQNVQKGIGEPFFASVETVISSLVFSVPGVRGIEFGDGFAAARMWGSEHNDPIINPEGRTSRNGAGGINGGITNGNEIVLRVAMKPASSIRKEQESINLKTGSMEKNSIPGRHDTCIALRAAVVLESVLTIALADLCLLARGRNYNWKKERD